ncbi:hypothetical protein [Providencia alcalifaciens]|uniref:hypothetical protein n=1 Tax=Providencia alcalifaciens TaxID=126385 RepID=UPI001CC5EBD7|nr:hypothetical protein [Providencia alcalifaciens]CAG9424948.1 hypothetical protein NVI2019_GHJFPKLH_02481 [Providencia alcalifaciens]
MATLNELLEKCSPEMRQEIDEEVEKLREEVMVSLVPAENIVTGQDDISTLVPQMP